MDAHSHSKAEAEAEATLTLRVASFNARVGTAEDGENGWALRAGAACEAVAGLGADLYGFQEVMDFQREAFAEALPGYAWLWGGREADGGGEGVPIAFRADRFALLEHRRFWLSDDPDRPGSRSRSARFPRLAESARLFDRWSGRALRFTNLHLDHATNAARMEGMGVLLSRLREWGWAGEGHWILAGDFNSDVDEEPISALMAESAREGWELSATYPGPGEVPAPGRRTRHDFGSEGAPGGKIDHIFAGGRGFRVVGGEIARARPGGRWPSDHDPVTATLRWR